MLGKSNKVLAVAVEYCAPHWVVLIRNPGQKNWTALRSKDKMVEVKNEFGETVRSFQAIESFESQSEAKSWVKEHLGEEVEYTPRKDSEIEKFLLRATSPVNASPAGV